MDDYYDRARGFPLVYSPDEDPEVIEEMSIAEAELKSGGDGGEDADEESTGCDSTGDEDNEDNEGNWIDADEIEGEGVSGADHLEKQKKKRKVLSCVDKVHPLGNSDPGNAES